MLARVNVLAHCWDTVTEFDSGYQPDGHTPASSSDDLREAGIGARVNAFRSCVDTGMKCGQLPLVLMVIPLLVAVVTL